MMQTFSKFSPMVAPLFVVSCATAQPKMPAFTPTPAPNSVLWYKTPAKSDLTEALPIGNGRIGALVYGGLAERIVLNDSSLWTGDTNPSGDYDKMGSYQMLGELLLTPDTTSAALPSVSAPSGQKAFFPAQEVGFASDDDVKTKWCVEHGGKPVVWQVEMPAGTAPATWYSFTSAEDVPGRDPSNFELAGSMDGQSWTNLDRQTNRPPLPGRGETARFSFANTTAYKFYRLTVQPNAGFPHFQVAEIGLEGLKPIPPGGAVAIPADFRRQLDLKSATATTQYTDKSVHFKREVFASQPADVMVVRWSADKPGALGGSIELKGAHGEKVGLDEAKRELSYRGRFENGLQYATQTRVLTKGGRVTFSDGKVQLQGCDEAIIFIGAGTSYIYDFAKKYSGPDPVPRINAQVDAAAKKTFAALQTVHQAQFQKVLGRVSLALGTTPANRTALSTEERRLLQAKQGDDPGFEALQFQYGRYLLVSCSRPGAVPANLQGLWSNSNNPPWYSDYHTNINIQMNYWPAEVTGLSEYQTPLFDLVKSQLPAWRQATAGSDHWKTPSGAMTMCGFAIRTSHNIHGGMGWNWDDTANAWYCQHFWEHYAFTGDKKYLRDTAYPIIKETVQFWEDHLKALPDGRLVVPHGWSPEHGPHEDGVSYNQQIVWDLFNNYTEAAKALGVDGEYAAKVAAMRDKLVGPKIGKWGQLQEWMEDRDDPMDQHRHTSHLFGVYPGRQFSIAQTPEFAKAARISLEARNNAPGGDVNEWACVWRAAIFARLHDGDRAHALLQRFAQFSCPNLFGSLVFGGVIPQIDGSFGYTAAVAEMLLQSHEGEINLLPALPKAWASGAVTGLKARGAVTVDMKWQNGQLQTTTLRSPVARTVTVRSGQRTAKIALSAGKAVAIGADLKTDIQPAKNKVWAR